MRSSPAPSILLRSSRLSAAKPFTIDTGIAYRQIICRSQPGNFPGVKPGSNPDARAGTAPLRCKPESKTYRHRSRACLEETDDGDRCAAARYVQTCPYATGTSTERPEVGQRAAGEPDDGALLADVAAGDVAALDLLYRRYRSLAFGVACKLLHDRAAAEDVVHDAFLSVWRAASSFQPDAARRGHGCCGSSATRRSTPSARGSWHGDQERRSPTSSSVPQLIDDVCGTVATASEARRLGAALGGRYLRSSVPRSSWPSSRADPRPDRQHIGRPARHGQRARPSRSASPPPRPADLAPSSPGARFMHMQAA